MKYHILFVSICLSIFSCTENMETEIEVEVHPNFAFGDFVDMSAIDSSQWWMNSIKVGMDSVNEERFLNAIAEMENVPDTSIETGAHGAIIFVNGELYSISGSGRDHQYLKVKKGLATKNLEHLQTTDGYLYFDSDGYDIQNTVSPDGID